MPRAKKTPKKVEKQAIVKIDPVPDRPWLLNTDEVAIVKNSIAKGASDQELTFLLTVARRYRLDPFRQQIWFVKRWDKNADNGHGGTGAYVWTPQVGINGLLFAAGRDHKEEFGSVSEPEYGPMVDITPKLKAPEWARVQVWKKGMDQPTVGRAYWEEYAPYELDKAPFWRKMPRRMLGKCATALAIRQAYPDLGGLYIPEECDRMNEEYTPSGRRIVEATDVSSVGSREAAQRVLQEKLTGKRPIHNPDEKPLEIEPEVATSGIPQAAKVAPLPDLPANAMQVVVDWHCKECPIVTGDPEAIEALKPLLTWKDEFWHVKAEDVRKIGEACAGAGYRFSETLPETSSGRSANTAPKAAAREGGGKPKATTAPAAEIVVTGVIQHFTEKMTRGDGKRASAPFLSVLFKTEDGDRWYSIFKRDLIDHVGKAKGKSAEFFVIDNGKYKNIVGIKRIGNTEFEDNLPVLQQKNREAGSLFT